MRRRLALVTFAALALVTGLAQPSPVRADTIERFTACVALSTTTPECSRQGAVVDAGAAVYLRGRVSPAHPGFGEVWRRSPGSSRFAKIGIMGVNQQGRIRWSWITDADDASSTPYTFQFRIPGHGRSWTTKVRVRRVPTSVSLCAAISATSPSCYNAGVTYQGGTTVFLRGQVRPPVAGTVEVLRQKPHEHRLSHFSSASVRADGRVRWTWATRRRDIDVHAPYLFALRLPDGHRSNLVEVWVVAEGH
jgi:hypothetical protein